MKWSLRTIFRLTAFVITVIVAIVLHWESHDLMWGTWASAVAYGYIYGLLIISCNPQEVDAPQGWSQPGRLLAMIAFFSFHFGLFHLYQGLILEIIFPLTDRNGQDQSIFRFPVIAFSTYWPLILVVFLSRAQELYQATSPADRPNRLLAPYRHIARMQVLVFVFLFMKAMGVIPLALYPILVFLYFPLPIIWPQVQQMFNKLESRMNDPDR
jgi:hypothetical protein